MTTGTAAMTAGAAREAAARWVADEAAGLPGFVGAVLHGSVRYLPGDAPLPASSDVDLLVVHEGDAPPPGLRRGKFLSGSGGGGGALLEVTPVAWAGVARPEAVLGDYHLAGGFRDPAAVLADPDGRLRALTDSVAREFARGVWVRARRQDAEARVRRNLDAAVAGGATAPVDRVMAWLFAAGVTTHVLLVSGLKNPTVRRRYVAARELLAEYGMPEFHDELLGMLGALDLTPERAAAHVDALAGAYDAAGAVVTPDYRFAADLTPQSRPVAIDGAREMIAAGDHREAMFWVLAVYGRCLQVFGAHAPEGGSAPLYEAHAAGYGALRADLGVPTGDALRLRAEAVRAFLPRLREVARRIEAANPGIVPD